MQFNSYSYLLLLIAVVPLFWLLPMGWRRAYVMLLSFGFYATWNPYFIILPLAVCGVAFAAGGPILKGGSGSGRALWSGVGAIIAILVFFKYGRFITENITALLHGFDPSAATTIWRIALPLGISFYSFEAISYLLDLRQGRLKTVGFGDLCLFIAFWPHLIAGPIVRTRELIPQLKFNRAFDTRLIYEGLDRLLLGLAQKNLIANTIGAWVDDGFVPNFASTNTTIDNWALAVGFGIQIYFDFSAYSNMAIGTSKLIGITLPENFRFPYHAATPSDFWSRWHMTLSRWIRDYIFFPLNARYGGRGIRLYLSLIGVMGVVGLWHGAGWGFILWGLMHGTYLALFRAFEAWRGPDWNKSFGPRVLCRMLTLVAVFAAWIPFRAASIGQALAMLERMFIRFSGGYSYSVNFYLMVAFWCGWIAVEPLIGRWLARADSAGNAGLIGRTNLMLLRPAGYSVLLLFFVMFDDRDMQFIYFQF